MSRDRFLTHVFVTKLFFKYRLTTQLLLFLTFQPPHEPLQLQIDRDSFNHIVCVKGQVPDTRLYLQLRLMVLTCPFGRCPSSIRFRFYERLADSPPHFFGALRLCGITLRPFAVLPAHIGGTLYSSVSRMTTRIDRPELI